MTLISSLWSVLGLAVSHSKSSQQACSALVSSLVDTQTLGDRYDYAKSHYWNAAESDDTPACVTFPTTAEDVSRIVSVLLEYTDVNFAMKSGGHNPNRGFSSVDGGVLISFSNMASTTYNPHSQTADVGPGGRWGQVYDALEPYGVTVVGGRIGDVGVGGLLLGGGLSFLSGQYGLACDSVVNYEVVLSNATIINANSTSNTDLFWALQGGGNQFGIVTKFTLKTYKIGQIWGGTRIYGVDESSAIIDAIHDFTTNYNDPKAAIIATTEITIDTAVQLWVIFLFYNGPDPPGSIFDKFNAIAAISDAVKTQSYPSMVNADNNFNIYGFRYLIRGTTLPNLPGSQGTDLYNYHYNSWKSYVTGGPILTNILDLNLGNIIHGVLDTAHVFSMAFQPLPHAIPAASQNTNPGGNVLGLNPTSGDHMWMEYDISWLSSFADADAQAVAINITRMIDDYAEKKYEGVANTNYQPGAGDVMAEEYTPTFLNDAMFDQKPLQSYGLNTYTRLKSIQEKYDPMGFFPGRTGGFKFT